MVHIFNVFQFVKILTISQTNSFKIALFCFPSPLSRLSYIILDGILNL